MCLSNLCRVYFFRFFRIHFFLSILSFYYTFFPDERVDVLHLLNSLL